MDLPSLLPGVELHNKTSEMRRRGLVHSENMDVIKRMKLIFHFQNHIKCMNTKNESRRVSGVQLPLTAEDMHDKRHG